MKQIGRIYADLLKQKRYSCAVAWFFFIACCGLGVVAQEEKDAIAQPGIPAPHSDGERVFDCGVNTIYLVLRLKKMEAVSEKHALPVPNIEEISGRLQRDKEKGSSIHDIETYLYSVGIRTDSRMMRLSDLCKKRGALAILLLTGKNKEVGHFVVGRVLPDRKLQVIDSLIGTYIDEKASTSRIKRFVILIDRTENNWGWKVLAFVSVAMLGAFIASVFLSQRRKAAEEEVISNNQHGFFKTEKYENHENGDCGLPAD